MVPACYSCSEWCMHLMMKKYSIACVFLHIYFSTRHQYKLGFIPNRNRLKIYLLFNKLIHCYLLRAIFSKLRFNIELDEHIGIYINN